MPIPTFCDFCVAAAVPSHENGIVRLCLGIKMQPSKGRLHDVLMVLTSVLPAAAVAVGADEFPDAGGDGSSDERTCDEDPEL